MLAVFSILFCDSSSSVQIVWDKRVGTPPVRCRCCHPYLTFNGPFVSWMASCHLFICCMDIGYLSHTSLSSSVASRVPVTLFPHWRVTKCCPRLAFFLKRDFVHLPVHSSVIASTLVCLIVPGNGTSASLMYLHVVFRLFQNALCATVATSCYAHGRETVPPDLKECVDRHCFSFGA